MVIRSLSQAVIFFFSCIFLLVVVLSTFLSGMFPLVSFGSFDGGRWLLVLFLSVSTVLSLVRLEFKRPSRSGLLFLVGVIIFSCSALLSDYLSQSLSKYWFSNFILFFFSLLFVPFFFSSFPFEEREKVLYCAFYAILSGTLIFSALYLFVFSLSIGNDVNYNNILINSGFVNINFFGQVATWVIPLLSAGMLDERISKSTLAKVLVFFSLSLFWFVIVSVSVKGTLISVVLAFIFMAIYDWHWIRGCARWAALSLIVAVFVWCIVAGLSGHLGGSASRGLVKIDDLGRVMLWQEALVMSFQRFPFGMGGESWVLHDVISQNFYEPLRHGHPHNMYLLFAAEYGWMAVVGLCLVFFGIFKRVSDFKLRMHDTELKSNTFAAGLCLSVLGGLIHSGVSGVLLMPKSMALGLICISMLWAVLGYAKAESVSSDRVNGGGQVLMRSIVVALCFLISVFWIKDVASYYKSMSVDKYLTLDSNVRYYPRFWQHGLSSGKVSSYQD